MAGWFQRSSTCLPVLSLLHLQATLLASRWIFQKYCLHPGSESLMNFLPSTSPNCPEGGVFTQNFIPGYSQQTPIDLCTFVLHNFLCKSLFQTRSHPKLLVLFPNKLLHLLIFATAASSADVASLPYSLSLPGRFSVLNLSDLFWHHHSFSNCHNSQWSLPLPLECVLAIPLSWRNRVGSNRHWMSVHAPARKGALWGGDESSASLPHRTWQLNNEKCILMWAMHGEEK